MSAIQPDFTRVLVACMPKSGSSFLSTLISCLPGMRRVHLTPFYQRREQEIDIHKLNMAEKETFMLRTGIQDPDFKFPAYIPEFFPRILSKKTADPVIANGYVAQHHVRYSLGTQKLMDEYDIKPVVLVRDIFDIVISLRDHIINSAPFMSMSYVSEDMRKWPEEKLEAFLIDMAVPWYFNFFMTWQECPDKLLLSYEKLRENPQQVLKEVIDFADFDVEEGQIEAAIKESSKKNTRKNKAVAGRGEKIDPEFREKILNYKSYYPDVDFSSIGL